MNSPDTSLRSTEIPRSLHPNMVQVIDHNVSGIVEKRGAHDQDTLNTFFNFGSLDVFCSSCTYVSVNDRDRAML